jgi:hypothetical protein
MGDEERLKQLRCALLALYSPEVPVCVRSEADAFLQSFLFSKDCWTLSLSLIRSPDAAFFEQLFCARALHQRLRCSVMKTVQTQASHQIITPEEWDKCREALIVLATRYSPEPQCRPIVTQLCMALAALAAKMEAWSCESLVHDIGQALVSAPLALAETLRVLPEEIESRALSIHPDRRMTVRLSLQMSSRRALDILDELWRLSCMNADGRLSVVVLQAVAAWIDFAPHSLRPVMSNVTLDALAILSGHAPPGEQAVAQVRFR